MACRRTPGRAPRRPHPSQRPAAPETTLRPTLWAEMRPPLTPRPQALRAPSRGLGLPWANAPSRVEAQGAARLLHSIQRSHERHLGRHSTNALPKTTAQVRTVATSTQTATAVDGADQRRTPLED